MTTRQEKYMNDSESRMLSVSETITLRESVYHAEKTPGGIVYTYTEYRSDGKRAIKVNIHRDLFTELSYVEVHFARVDGYQDNDAIAWNYVEHAEPCTSEWYDQTQAHSQYAAPLNTVGLATSLAACALRLLCWDA